MVVVLKVLVREEPLGIHFLKKGIITKQGTYIMVNFGTGILNNYEGDSLLTILGMQKG